MSFFKKKPRVANMPASIPDTLPELTELFEKCGATDPEDWARSQLEEGIPQLYRYLFLRQAWRDILEDGDTSWIDSWIDEADKYPGTEFTGVGAALKRCLDKGATKEDLSEIARGMQADFLCSFSYKLIDPMLEEPELKDVWWCLFATDHDGYPIFPIEGLHESAMRADPTRRDMKPRTSDK